jgi:hypothetical protein
MYNSFLMVFIVILYLFSSNIEKVTNMYTLLCLHLKIKHSFAKALNDIINHCENGSNTLTRAMRKNFLFLTKMQICVVFFYMFHKI